MAAPDVVVALRGLTKAYPGVGRPAVDGVELDIPRGRIFGLLGPNGAGKTTLLSMICGLLTPDAGTVRVLTGEADRDGGGIKRRLGLVPQDLALYPTLSGRENLRFFGRMQGLRGAALNRRVSWCLKMGGLQEVADRRVETYSGGLRRRLNLVIGLIHEPELLILDEPTVGIDPHSRRFIHERLRRLNAGGLSIIYTSHYMDEIEQLCDELAIIDHGRIIARGTLDEILGSRYDGTVELRLGTSVTPLLRKRLRRLPGVQAMRFDGKSVMLRSARPARTAAAALALAERDGVELAYLSYGAAHLEQVFLALTGTRLRDG